MQVRAHHQGSEPHQVDGDNQHRISHRASGHLARRCRYRDVLLGCDHSCGDRSHRHTRMQRIHHAPSHQEGSSFHGARGRRSRRRRSPCRGGCPDHQRSCSPTGGSRGSGACVVSKGGAPPNAQVDPRMLEPSAIKLHDSTHRPHP
uniref:Uncharacterized protein n=1 Tax=Arundo donax TaxID=35708 RepID=A0A0A9DE38_ARUDO